MMDPSLGCGPGKAKIITEKQKQTKQKTSGQVELKWMKQLKHSQAFKQLIFFISNLHVFIEIFQPTGCKIEEVRIVKTTV